MAVIQYHKFPWTREKKVLQVQITTGRKQKQIIHSKATNKRSTDALIPTKPNKIIHQKNIENTSKGNWSKCITRSYRAQGTETSFSEQFLHYFLRKLTSTLPLISQENKKPSSKFLFTPFKTPSFEPPFDHLLVGQGARLRGSCIFYVERVQANPVGTKKMSSTKK